MRKFLSIFAAMLVALAVNAQTDFAAPGYSCAADDAVLTGGSASHFYLQAEAEPHYVAWADCALSENALATWTVSASRGCYVTVSLDLGPVIASNKHNFEVTIRDASGNVKGMLTEGGENTASEQVKALDGTILMPAAGTYTVEVYNNRDWGKGTIKNVILTYAADAPAELIPVSGIELNKPVLELEVAEVEQLIATVSPEDAFDPSVTWVSSDETVVTVVDGFVSAIAAGTATITATAGEMSATCPVTVAAATIPSTDFAEPFALTAKKAMLEGAIWKMYKDETYKLYGDGGHNINYGTAIWNLNVTKACSVTAVLNGVEGGHTFVLDLYNGEELVASLNQPDGATWSAGEIAMDGSLTFAAAGNYILKLRNTQEWSSGKVAGVTLTAVLENGFYLVGTINDWTPAAEYHLVGNPGTTEFMVTATLAEGDGIKVCNVVDNNVTAWYPEGEGNEYVVDAAHAGEKTIYFQPDYKADWAAFGGYMWIDANEEPQPIVSEWAEIVWTEAVAADDIAEEASYTVPDTEFALTLHDAGNKMAIDGNDCRFGTAEAYTMYNFRIKSGGASSSTKNYFTLNIPEAGTLRLAPRTGSNSATDRALVITQGEDTLYNAVVQESQAIEITEGEQTVKVYPYVEVAVAAGEVRVSYTAGMNFYAFAFKAGDEPQPVEHTYTVAGSSADLFGTAWDPANVANDMALQEDGTYKWEKTEITLPEGAIEFKVCQNHAWTNCWPAENYSMPIPEAGIYTITITYNPEGNVVAGDAVKTGDAVVDPVVSIAGSMNSWSTSADVMTLAADKATASLTLNLTAATYDFKVVLNGGDWRSNAHEFTRENATAAEMTGNEANMHLVADMDGDYVFTWTFATNTLVITYPSAGPEPLVIPTEAPVPTVAEDDVMAIFCNHYTTNNANFGISGWAGGYQILDLNGINVGYWTGMTWECIIDPAHTGDPHDFSAYKNIHVDLWAPLPAKIKFTAEAVADYKDGQIVEMQQGWNSVDFVVADWAGNYDFKNLKCFVFEQYQTLAGESFEGNPFAFANIYFYGKEEQGVENTAVDAKVVKTIINGQLFIEKNGKLYNAQGALVR